MVKKLITGTLVHCMFMCSVYAQDDKHENHMKQVDPVENEFYRVEFSKVHCQKAFAMGRMLITNKTSDYLLIDLHRISGTFDFGNKTNENSKLFFIEPFGSSNKAFKYIGENMHVENFSIDAPAFSILPLDGQVQNAEDFALPPTKNNIQIGGFNCAFDKMTKKTDKLNTNFKCTYVGESYGLVDETKATFIYPNGKEYANAQNKQKIVILDKGDSNKFSFNCSEHKSDGDLQFIEMKIKWNDAFKESQTEELPSFHVDFELDRALTEASNL